MQISLQGSSDYGEDSLGQVGYHKLYIEFMNELEKRMFRGKWSITFQ